MMLTYRARLRLSGSVVGKIQSDTLFGGLCWAYHDSVDETRFNELLERCLAGTPPFVVSDPFPGDLLPKPLLPPPAVAEGDAPDKAALVSVAKQAKKIKDIQWLSLTEFDRLLAGQAVVPERKPVVAFTRMTLHNTINRDTGTTLADGGGLYDLPESFFQSEYLSVYCRVEPGWEEVLRQCLTQLGKTGFGGRRSIGKGGFDLMDFEPFDGFVPASGDVNAFVSLSHFVPAADDPAEGCYKTMVKYPRLDREYSKGTNLFKHPLMLLIPGSVFRTGAVPRPFYGRAVPNIAPGLAAAIQGAFAFAVPFRWQTS